MQAENILTEVRDNTLYITINRPKALNALSIKTIVEIDEALEEYMYHEDVKGVVITGAGEKAFVAGADISEFSDFTPEQGKTMSENGHDTFDKIESYPKPVIAAVNGYALGGGCELAMACHMRIASENAIFGQPEVNLGLIPGYGGTQRLPELIGKGKALELLLTGDSINAAMALELGLVNDVVPQSELMKRVQEILQKIYTKGPVAVSKIIQSVNAHYRSGSYVGDGYKTEISQFSACMDSEDFREGTAAFLEKRKPQFQGR
ncbi:MAG: enoyl-CoA hydratase/isomerase family protein [Chitinophagales bacterium]|nr:enoyl-CoA hydratase/isomerase family protein [Chitinophagales bacterium]HAE14509.1 enoyl-CoA hydratase [Bacteroidota bacterium]MCB9021365.1 enoyl-CoA hydratase/isomerase family protein [Chitinophagales bacterium]MCB9031680.1 enoyl-CoA hydratase/isomerase family protein [Chitinophagales bacterium]HAE34900.1 enoyl-CoA hydratase [Bacteroidota bacterium]